MIWFDTLVVVWGLLIGSFLNVCIYRIPRGRSVVREPSSCPHCGTQIRPWHNIPIVSFLLLRGKCAHCGGPISRVYPLVELATAVLFYLAYLKYQTDPAFLVNIFFFSLLMVLIFIDLFERILPDLLTLGGGLVGFLISPFQSEEFLRSDPLLGGEGGIWVDYVHSALGALMGAGILWLVATLYLKIKKIEGMGFGDVKMMGMVGAFLGWRYVWLAIFLGSFIGAVVGFLYIWMLGKGRRYELPFGSFLGLGAIITTLWGQNLVSWYLSLY